MNIKNNVYNEKDTEQIITQTIDELFEALATTVGPFGTNAIIQDGSNRHTISKDGYTLLKSLGHKIVEPFPGLVQLELEGNIFKSLKGVKFPGKARLYSGKKLLIEDFGDILFTDYGISGPPILQISRTALKYLKNI